MFACQPNLLHPKALEKAVLTFICQQSNSLYNSALYQVRQRYFQSSKLLTNDEGITMRKGGSLVGYSFLCQQLKHQKNYQNLYSQAAQQTLKNLAESLQSYRRLLTKFRAGELNFYPSLPNYRKSGGLYTVTYPSQALKLVDNQIKLSLGRQIKAWFGLSSISLPWPDNLDFHSLRELRILPRNGCFYAEYVYTQEVSQPELESNQALAIDHGVNNLLTCVDTKGNSFIIEV